jgi:uncharacterized membrane protein YfcA
MTILAAVGLGILIGVSLGALGGGGSILTVPALVYVVGEPAHAAITESLVIVGIASIVGTVGHARVKHVRWGSGIVFGLIGIVSSYAGTALNRHVNPNALLLAFAVLIVVAASGMLRRVRAQTRVPALPEVVPAEVSAGSASAAGTRSSPHSSPDGAPIESASINADGQAVRTNVALKTIMAGLAVGFLTGFFGVGGGFVIVPALVMALGYDMPIAIGTSLLIITINSAASLAARAGSEALHWSVVIPFTVAAIAGSLGGKRVADHVPSTTLTKAFVTLLFAVAAYIAIRSGIALTSSPE